jgi:hypothetical protein
MILTTFSTILLLLVFQEYLNYAYASNLSCVQITKLMTCEEQQNGLKSSDGGTSDIIVGNEAVDASTSNNEDDEISLMIPDISPTLDKNGDDDGEERLGQKSSENGEDGTNSKGGNDRASGSKDDDIETSVPLILPFP